MEMNWGDSYILWLILTQQLYQQLLQKHQKLNNSSEKLLFQAKLIGRVDIELLDRLNEENQ